MFAFVLIEPRYIAPFIVLFWIAVYDLGFSGLRRWAPAFYRGAMGVAAICVFLPPSLDVAFASADLLRRPLPRTDMIVAEELSDLGIRPGDEIATIGPSYGVYYARLAGLKIVANVGFDDTDQVWTLSAKKFDTLREDLRRIGVKAIVGPDRCGSVDVGWRSIRETTYCVNLLK